MPCPVNKCVPLADGGVDHQLCLVELFETNRIQTIAEWHNMWKPKTIIKRKVKVRIPKE
jgi:hypothetical protein